MRYNPFYCCNDDYMSVVNMVFGFFNLHDEFFAKYQLNYLADIVRVLVTRARLSGSRMVIFSDNAKYLLTDIKPYG